MFQENLSDDNSVGGVFSEKGMNVKDITRMFSKQISLLGDEVERERKIRLRNQQMRQKYLGEKLRSRTENFSSAERMEERVNCQNEKELVPKLGQEPLPVPPKTTKDTLYSERGITDLFDDLEQFAINMDSENVTFPVLMKQLFIWKLTDLEKVRVLFHWISSQDLNAIKFPDQLILDSPFGRLKAIKENTTDFALVFQRLCRAAGIHCKVIKGYVKGVGYYPDHSFSSNPHQFRGTWNAVLINNEWRFIDTHWGARSRNEKTGELTYKFEEFWFLTDPNKFISSHYADESAWQLLHHPITLDQFKKRFLTFLGVVTGCKPDILNTMSVKQWPMYYQLKLASAHQNAIVQTDENGFVKVTLNYGGRDAKFSTNLHEKVESKLQDEVLNSVKIKRSEEEQVFEVRLREPGQYILTILGKPSSDTKWSYLCRYQIDGSKIKSDTE